MNEDRRKILEILAQGKITADEAERLIAALEKSPSAPGAANGNGTSSKSKPNYLRLVVSDEDKQGRPVRVNIRVPVKLLRAGVKLTSLVPAQARDQVNAALHREGLPFDLNQITSENLEEIIEQLDELTIDVDDRKTKVRFFCE